MYESGGAGQSDGGDKGFASIRCVPREGWLEIVLAAPERRNALTGDMLAELSTALWAADADEAVGAVLISADGPDFCAGYFIGGGQAAAATSSKGKSFEQDIVNVERLQRSLLTLFDMHKPVIAKVHGRCLAGGTDLTFLCDMVLAAEDATFGFPATRDLGSPPTPMWLHHVGPQWAKRLLLTGDLICGREAAKLGLVMKALPADQLDREAEGLAARLGKIDAALLAANKRSVNMMLELMGARTALRFCAELDARAHLAPTPTRIKEADQASRVSILKQRRDDIFGKGQIMAIEADNYSTATAGKID